MKILGIGNAIVDVICKVNEDFIVQNKLTKGTMKLIFDEKEFKSLLSNLEIEKGLKVIKVKTSDEMFKAVKKSLPVDVAVCTAAVSDFKPSTFQKNKIKKNKSKERIDLDGTIDILNYIGKNNQHRPKLVIGFSAETEKLLHNSKIKLKNKNADWIIANDVSKKDIGFNKDYNAVTIIRSDGKVSQIKKNKKSFIASIISGEIIKKLLINDKSLN